MLSALGEQNLRSQEREWKAKNISDLSVGHEEPSHTNQLSYHNLQLGSR